MVWTPVLVTEDGRVKLDVKDADAGKPPQSSHEPGWLASRQPPVMRYGPSASEALEIDITGTVITALQDAKDACVEILYDNRFLLTIRPHNLSPDVLTAVSAKGGKLVVTPHSRYFLPRLVLRAENDIAYQASARDDERVSGRQRSRFGCLRVCDHELGRVSSERVASVQGIPQMGEDNKDESRTGVDRDAVRMEFVRQFC